MHNKILVMLNTCPLPKPRGIVRMSLWLLLPSKALCPEFWVMKGLNFVLKHLINEELTYFNEP